MFKKIITKVNDRDHLNHFDLKNVDRNRTDVLAGSRHQSVANSLPLPKVTGYKQLREKLPSSGQTNSFVLFHDLSESLKNYRIKNPSVDKACGAYFYTGEDLYKKISEQLSSDPKLEFEGLNKLFIKKIQKEDFFSVLERSLCKYCVMKKPDFRNKDDVNRLIKYLEEGIFRHNMNTLNDWFQRSWENGQILTALGVGASYLSLYRKEPACDLLDHGATFSILRRTVWAG